MARSAVELPCGQGGRATRPRGHNGSVSSLEKYVKVRITAKRRQRWQFAATLRGLTLSELVRTAVEAELAAPAATAQGEGAAPSAAPHASSARAPASLEERIQAAVELVDGL